MKAWHAITLWFLLVSLTRPAIAQIPDNDIYAPGRDIVAGSREGRDASRRRRHFRRYPRRDATGRQRPRCR